MTSTGIRARQTASYWHDSSRHPLALGCTDCAFFDECGGLNVPPGIFDCGDFCTCWSPKDCDIPCPKNPKTLHRYVREVRGVTWENIPRFDSAAIGSFPVSVPIIYHGSSRLVPYDGEAAALMLYDLLSFPSATLKYSSREELYEKFSLAPDVKLMVCGVAGDRELSRIWSHLDAATLVAGFIKFGVQLMTSPNFSVFSNVPRTDNLVSQKRIVTLWHELSSRGLPTALHLNPRTDADWNRIFEFVTERDEVTSVCFEFGTVGRYKSRIPWHVERLRYLGQVTSSRLTLVAKGGLPFVEELGGWFREYVFLESESFVRTHKRKKLVIGNGGELVRSDTMTLKGQSLHDLFHENCGVVRTHVERQLRQT